MTTPAVGSIWKSRYTTGLRVTVTETDGSRIRIADIDPTTGLPRARARWTPVRRFTDAYTEDAR
ncbi:hypothetical protein ACH4TP_38025 [Streptomyces sp. NPDC021012]|uniref:hypothetical protein n=1 Tax=Streptomyces sp. NPDC021012 TaxID=3365107 RepID=UPI0037BA8560